MEFGCWDAGNDQTTWQQNLEVVIKELEKTKSKLIRVTQSPVTRGFPPAGELTGDGKAPRRTAGVMQKCLNPWALEVVKQHPQISVCDPWQHCRDHNSDTYQQWWTGKDVHFKGAAANVLGQILAEHVLKVTQDR